jgi:low temperature requirement protein LtrA
VDRNEPDRLDVLVRFAPTAFAGALLILAAGFLDGNWRLAAWIAALGAPLVSALWWLYFDVAAIFARRRLAELRGIDGAKLASGAYTYLHLPMVAGIVLFVFGLKTTLHHVDDALETAPAVALCGGTALYLLAHVGLTAGACEASGWSSRLAACCPVTGSR